SDHRHLHSFPTRRSSDLPPPELDVVTPGWPAGRDTVIVPPPPPVPPIPPFPAWPPLRPSPPCPASPPCPRRPQPQKTPSPPSPRSEEHTSELQSLRHLVC